jgi:outer membrane biosynthesis protein TonB
VYIDDDTKEATVIVPEDQLALAIGKEGLNARLAARLTGWKVDIQSEAEFAQAEAEAAFAGGEEGDDFSGRCAAILSNGKRCPNAALPRTRFCGIPAHTALAEREARGETVEEAVPVAGSEPEETEALAEGEVAVETPPGPEPSEIPTPEPSPTPAPEPSPMPAPEPSPAIPEPAPSEIPSPEPAEVPSPEPSEVPPSPAAEQEEQVGAARSGGEERGETPAA